MLETMKQRFDLLAKDGWTADLSTYPNDQIGLLTMVKHPTYGGPMFLADAFRKLGYDWKMEFQSGRTNVYLGEINIGLIFGWPSDQTYSIACNGHAVIQNQNYGKDFEAAKNFFRMSVPEPCREHLKFVRVV